MMLATASGGRRRTGAFTLIELLAVVAIFALIAGLALPNLQIARGRDAEQDAERLAAGLVFARQRAVATGVPHRAVLDLDLGDWWLEWWATEARVRGEPEPEPPDVYSVAPGAAVPMSPPREAEHLFRPLAGALGRPSPLSPGVVFAGVETAAGVSEAGQVELRFDADGTTEATEIVLADEEGGRIHLDLAPLADALRIARGDD